MSFVMNQLLQNFNKQYFDFDAPIIRVHEFHPQLRIILAMNGLFFSNKTSKLRFIIPSICIVLSFIASGLEMITCYHAIMTADAALLTEAFAYGVIIGVVPFLYMCMFKNAIKIYALVDCMDENFKSICLLGEPYRKNFLKGQLTIWKCGFAWLVFVIFVASIYILLSVVAILYYCLIVEHREDSSRPLVFPVWLPRDAHTKSPTYEFLLGIMYLIILDFVLTFTTYVYILFHLLLHCYFLINMVIIGLENLLLDVDEEDASLDIKDARYLQTKAILQTRLKKIVTWHSAVFDLVLNTLDVYGAVLAYQVIFSSIVICLVSFNLSLQIEHGTFDIRVGLLAIGALLQLWIPCYLGSLLRQKGYDVADVAFYCGWHSNRLGKMVKTDLQLIIVRSQRPITIQVTPLPVLGLETFSSIMSTAYSYFNMLRQTGE